MTIDEWLDHACADADRRALPDLKPLLKTLAEATRLLRAADWNDAGGAVRQQSDGDSGGSLGRPARGEGR